MIWYRSIFSFFLVLDLWYWCKRVIKKAIKYNKKSEVQLSFPRNLIRAKLRKISDSWISNFIWILSNSTFQVHYEIKEIICTDETLYLRKVYFYYKLSCFAADIQKKSVRLYSTTEQVSTFFSRNLANFFEIGWHARIMT